MGWYWRVISSDGDRTGCSEVIEMIMMMRRMMEMEMEMEIMMMMMKMII